MNLSLGEIAPPPDNISQHVMKRRLMDDEDGQEGEGDDAD